ncbi:MAG: NUDIX domain-containing protein [Candidatus Saccharimonas aalborgensis]
MAHIHTKPGQHDMTVAAHIIRVDGKEPTALLHMHKKLATLICVGGHVELDESPWDAVIHEIAEEAGYDIKDLQVLQPPLRIHQEGIDDITIHPQPFFLDTHMNANTPDHWHTDTVYLFTTHSGPTLPLAADESQDIRWLSRSEIEQLPDSQIFSNIRTTHLKAFDEFLTAWEPVPAGHFSTEKIAR